MASVPRRLRSASLPRLALALLAVGLGPSRSTAQTFTRVLSGANPVLADLLETGGTAWADLDGDGDLDLFVAHGNVSNQDNALFVNLGNFQFQRVVTGSVGADGGSSIGGCWGDYDRDGHPDLFVANRNAFGNFLYHATGDTTFTRLPAAPPATHVGNSNSAAWLDIDRDGDLDLHVVNFQGNDFLFLNSGPPAWSLDRVTPAWLNGTTFSIMGAWADVDLDGDLDLFIANAGSQNDELWINQGGLAFTKRDIPDGRNTLGASWADFDGDGDLDLFTAGYLGQQSILYRNGGAPGFDLTPVGTDVFPATFGDAVGSAWGDVDNDGDLDLLVAFDNGQSEALFLDSGPPDWTFTRVAGGDLATDGGNSFGCALVDIDDDGDLDAFVANRTNQADFLFRNDGAPRHWLTLRLHGTVSSPSAEGARVRVHAMLQGAPRTQFAQVLPGSGYNTQTLDLHFGLDDATSASLVEVDWPSGIHQEIANVTADQRLVIVEDASTAVTASRVFARVANGAVELAWEVSSAPGEETRIERSTGGSGWIEVAAPFVDGARRVTWRDAAVAPGTTYAYRLRLRDGDLGWVDADRLSVTVPVAPPWTFALARDPGDRLVARVSAPAAGEARIELVDLAGRVLRTRRESLGPGERRIDLGDASDLAPGVYFARLRHPAGERTARLLLLR